MKTIFRVSMLAVFTIVAAVSGFAQDPCADAFEVKTAAYDKFKAARGAAKSAAEHKTAIDIGKEFVAKYGTCEDSKAVVEFINKKLPELQSAYDEKVLIERVNKNITDAKNVNSAEAFSSVKELITKKPEYALDLSIVLASIGFDNSIKPTPVDTYNNDAITFAKSAIQQIESGKTSKNYGAGAYLFAVKDASGNPDPVKSKDNALAYLNYYIANIMYYNQKMKKDALPFFYKAAQYSATVKDKPDVYQAIGAWYLDEILAMDAKRLEIIKANENKDNEESLKMFAMEKGYADRAIDAYARAYKLASSPTFKGDPKYKQGLYEKLQGLYKLRFDKTEGMDAYIASLTSKPLPNPATEVTPVVETPPATTTTTTSTTSSTTTPASTTTKPAATTTTTTKPATTNKPISSTTTKPATTTTPKKTGNR